MKNSTRDALVAFLMAGLLCLAGCSDLFLKGPPVPGDPAAGDVTLTIESGGERTIYPQAGQFSKIVLTFARKDGEGTLPPVEVQGGARRSTWIREPGKLPPAPGTVRKARLWSPRPQTP
ncbi:MAG: hypothetical protein LBT14_07810 [Treponema sp.]|jgi:hypothetical protein|nr:hypothetical protein [Treponema sp.]